MSKLRFEVVTAAFGKKAVEVPLANERPSKYYAEKVFNREKMFKYLPGDVYTKLIDVIDNGAPMDLSIADSVADGMKRWAIENGATHYTHWFHPLTETTAEKHDQNGAEIGFLTLRAIFHLCNIGTPFLIYGICNEFSV